MTQFTGEFESTVDSKQRFLFPAAFKKMLPQDGPVSFILNRGKEQCLSFFIKDDWNAMLAKKFDGLDYDEDANVREYQRAFMNGATEVDFDAAGRLTLPKTLIPHAKIVKDIVLVGARDRIEIWDAGEHQKLRDGITQERYNELGKKYKQAKDEQAKG
jgi:MraZ protein